MKVKSQKFSDKSLTLVDVKLVLPSKAGAVSQNSSLFDMSWPSVRGMSRVQRIFSGLRGLFLVTGARLESERPEAEPLLRRPPE